MTMRIIKWHIPAGVPGAVRTSALISSLVVLPFIFLELKNRQSYPGSFPFPLFGVMWLLPLSFILILRPIVREARTAKGIIPNPGRFLPSVGFLVVIAWFWVSLIIDQMPCFLGVPNCD